MAFGKPYGPKFYARPAESLALALIGQVLVRKLPDGTRISGMIVETEAYVGVRDEACHSYGGHRSPRVEAMYGRCGTAYVYFTYGMHYCMNVVCGEPGEPVAVLIRAVQPRHGIAEMQARRQGKSKRKLKETELCNGPAKVCQAFGIGPELNCHDMSFSKELWIESGKTVLFKNMELTPRIGLGSVGVWKHAPLRFVMRECEYASKPPKPAKPGPVKLKLVR